jgi:Sec7-like guanine-nucleotide exchange factor
MLIFEQQAIYDSIKKREIVMPDEHVGQLGFDYAWKELLIRSKQTSKSYQKEDHNTLTRSQQDH